MMEIYRTDIAIVGAGSAGLSAAYQAATAGAKVLVIDENRLPGGQLFKQIHKFFGSRAHKAGTRGYVIGRELLEKVEESGAEVWLDALVYGMQKDRSLGVIRNGKHIIVEAKAVIVATGAKENYMAFPGSTLPGVMGAGAAQTMINVNRVLPGERILMVGSGNVGLIVSYQLMQAGADVLALVEGAPKIGSYGVQIPVLVHQLIAKEQVIHTVFGGDAFQRFVEAVPVVDLYLSLVAEGFRDRQHALQYDLGVGAIGMDHVDQGNKIVFDVRPGSNGDVVEPQQDERLLLR